MTSGNNGNAKLVCLFWQPWEKLAHFFRRFGDSSNTPTHPPPNPPSQPATKNGKRLYILYFFIFKMQVSNHQQNFVPTCCHKLAYKSYPLQTHTNLPSTPTPPPTTRTHLNHSNTQISPQPKPNQSYPF